MFFKKRNKKEKEMTWMDVTLRQLIALGETVKIENDVDREYEIMKVFFGDKIDDIPATEFKMLKNKLNFLNEEMPNTVPPKKYEINGRKYKITSLISDITTAQYVDVTNQLNTNDMAKIVSVFVIPEGHKYNDGYDMEEVINDVYDFPAPIVTDLSAFFLRQLKTFTKIFQSYSTKKIKKQKMTKEMEKATIDMVNNLVHTLLSV